MTVSARTLAIAQMLVEAKGEYIQAGKIAKNLGVSSKTISRESSHVEAILQKAGLQLVTKAGAGISAQGSEAAYEDWLSHYGDVKTQAVYSPQERQAIILSQLLPNKEPIKLFALASRLKVTDGTISNDLDRLEPWFHQHQLELVRKPGLGVYVRGSEQDVRKAIIQFIYSQLNEKQLLRLAQEDAKDKKLAANQYLLNLIDENIVKQIETMLKQTLQSLDLHLSDNAFIGLVVHFSLAVQRIRQQDEIHIDEDLLAELCQKNEFQIASRLAKALEKSFGIQMSDAEIGYITMHILGARNRYRDGAMHDNGMLDDFHLVQMALDIMQRAEQATGKKLRHNQTLLAGLVNHLGPSVSRLKLGMDIRNPLLGQMQKFYPDLMQIARKSVVGMESELGQELPASEVAYIAMHLGAALTESDNFQHVHHRVAVACPTGMGTSRMLKSRINKLYDNLEVVAQVSTLSLSDDFIRERGIEFVISTVPISGLQVPVVVASSLLDGEDIRRVDDVLMQLKAKQPPAAPQEQKPDFEQSLAKLNAYGAAISELLRNFFFASGSAKNIKEACELAGRLTADDFLGRRGIADELLAREAKGGTILRGNQMVLLHAKSNFSTKLQFGIIHLGDGFIYRQDDKDEVIRTAIVMLAPTDSSAYAIETMGYISSVLLDRWGFIAILHEGSRESIKEELIHIFQEFYHKQYQMLMEG